MQCPVRPRRSREEGIGYALAVLIVLLGCVESSVNAVVPPTRDPGPGEVVGCLAPVVQAAVDIMPKRLSFEAEVVRKFTTDETLYGRRWANGVDYACTIPAGTNHVVELKADNGDDYYMAWRFINTAGTGLELSLSVGIDISVVWNSGRGVFIIRRDGQLVAASRQHLEPDLQLAEVSVEYVPDDDPTAYCCNACEYWSPGAYRVTGDDSILVNHATSGSFTAAGELYAFSSLKATSWEEGADCESFPPLHWALWLDEAVLE